MDITVTLLALASYAPTPLQMIPALQIEQVLKLRVDLCTIGLATRVLDVILRQQLWAMMYYQQQGRRPFTEQQVTTLINILRMDVGEDGHPMLAPFVDPVMAVLVEEDKVREVSGCECLGISVAGG